MTHDWTDVIFAVGVLIFMVMTERRISHLRRDVWETRLAFRRLIPPTHSQIPALLDRRAAELEVEAMLLALYKLDQHLSPDRTPKKGPRGSFQA